MGTVRCCIQVFQFIAEKIKKESDMKYDIIKCPACGAEYLPGEIFLPKHFLGQPKEVIKDLYGKIKAVAGGIEQDLEESYVCDKCDSEFVVIPTIKYKTELIFKRKKTDYIQKL